MKQYSDWLVWERRVMMMTRRRMFVKSVKSVVVLAEDWMLNETVESSSAYVHVAKHHYCFFLLFLRHLLR